MEASGQGLQEPSGQGRLLGRGVEGASQAVNTQMAGICLELGSKWAQWLTFQVRW